MELFLLLISLPIALGISFAFYRYLHGRGLPVHLCLILGLVTMLPACGLAIWMTLWLWR